MSPDDPRHGKHAGYLAHLVDAEDPCVPCRVARNRKRKILRFENDRGVRMLYSGAEFAAVMDPWLAMGLRVGDVARAAGWAPGASAHLHEALRAGGRVRRGTYLRLAAVTEDTFPDTAMVYAHLTRTRIYSLMAAGQSLRDMPIAYTGRWRTSTHLSIGTARAVRDYFAANEAKMGPNKNTAAQARRAGHVPPLAWDDPGTLAWPTGQPTQLARGVRRDLACRHDVDTWEDHDELAAEGYTREQIADRLGMSKDALEKALKRRRVADAAAAVAL